MDLTDKGIREQFNLKVSRRELKEFKKLVISMYRREKVLPNIDWVSEDLFAKALLSTKYIRTED